jgi:hypothetical protein
MVELVVEVIRQLELLVELEEVLFMEEEPVVVEEVLQQVTYLLLELQVEFLGLI